jgi:hypothetical protein
MELPGGLTFAILENLEGLGKKSNFFYCYSFLAY